MLTTNQKIDAIDLQLRNYEQSGMKVVASSSFQTHSIPMLHLLSRIAPEVHVAFLDTGYHFPETLAFRDEISERLDLNLVNISGHEPSAGSGLYVSSETACCNVNKVEPLHSLLAGFDVWVSGVRSDQTSNRAGFATVMAGPADTERYHPMLSWSADEIESYRRRFELPAHPLEELGYRSIGCAPCTAVPTVDDRSGRWASTGKTECGLHLVS